MNFPARNGYAETITEADGKAVLKLSGRPECGKTNAWQISIVSLSYENPGGKTFRLRAEIKAEQLGQGEFWLVLREISATGQTLTYDGILLKQDCDWTAMEKDVLVRKEAVELAIFAVGVNMPEGAAGHVRNATFVELR